MYAEDDYLALSGIQHFAFSGRNRRLSMDCVSALERAGLDPYVGFLRADRPGKALFSLWQERKRDEITHPYLKEKVAWGLVPHVQALLLARFVRGDLDGYPPFLWK